jgi:hypothetical protein
MSKKYYTLVVRVPTETWGPEFGDYSRAVVAQEKDNIRKDWPRGTEFKIIATDGRQASINEAVRKLNNPNEEER